MTKPAPSRLSPGDVVRVGGAGLRTRPLRVVLSAVGIAIGVAAMIAVVGVSASGRAQLDRQLASLGTNLLTAAPGSTLFGDAATLPADSVAMVARIGPVESVSAVARVPDVGVYRNEHIPRGNTNSIALYAARLDLLSTLNAVVAAGRWFDAATANYPTVVLGDRAAARLGITAPGAGVQVVIGQQRYTVIGVLAAVPLAAELDSAALVGWPAAERYLAFAGNPTTIYTRCRDDSVPAVRAVLAASVNPAHPEEVAVSRPSDVLAARQASDQAFSGLLLGLMAVALLVGGIGVANTMVISVLERRSEIGLRRALGATRGQVGLQFLVESQLLAALGGAGGVVCGVLVTAAYAATQGWPTVVPPWVTAGGLATTLVIGAGAGLYPAIRAARLSPTAALSTP